MFTLISKKKLNRLEVAQRAAIDLVFLVISGFQAVDSKGQSGKDANQKEISDLMKRLSDLIAETR